MFVCEKYIYTCFSISIESLTTSRCRFWMDCSVLDKRFEFSPPEPSAAVVVEVVEVVVAEVVLSMGLVVVGAMEVATVEEQEEVEELSMLASPFFSTLFWNHHLVYYYICKRKEVFGNNFIFLNIIYVSITIVSGTVLIDILWRAFVIRNSRPGVVIDGRLAPILARYPLHTKWTILPERFASTSAFLHSRMNSAWSGKWQIKWSWDTTSSSWTLVIWRKKVWIKWQRSEFINTVLPFNSFNLVGKKVNLFYLGQWHQTIRVFADKSQQSRGLRLSVGTHSLVL